MREMGLFSLEKNLWGDLIVVQQYLKALKRKMGREFLLGPIELIQGEMFLKEGG